MNTETITIDNFTVSIAQDEMPDNPFTDWDCEPPLLTYYAGITKYGNTPDIATLVAALPTETWHRKNRVALIRKFLKASLKEFADFKRDSGYGDKDAFAQLCEEEAPRPSGYRSWSEAVEYFDMLEYLAKAAGIPVCSTQSNGYSQGDCALVIAFATPEWTAKVGAPEDTLQAQMDNTCKLYSYWAWGNVYGVDSITDPEGNEIEGASCWGYYGPHEESGLLEHVKSAIEDHKKTTAKEQEEVAYWNEREIVTIS